MKTFEITKTKEKTQPKPTGDSLGVFATWGEAYREALRYLDEAKQKKVLILKIRDEAGRIEREQIIKPPRIRYKEGDGTAEGEARAIDEFAKAYERAERKNLERKAKRAKTEEQRQAIEAEIKAIREARKARNRAANERIRKESQEAKAKERQARKAENKAKAAQQQAERDEAARKARQARKAENKARYAEESKKREEARRTAR